MSAALVHMELVDAGIPIEGVADNAGSYTVIFKPEATAEQQTTAAAIVAAFNQVTSQTKFDRKVAAYILNDTAGAAKILRAVVLAMVDAINIERAQHGRAAITPTQARNSILAKLNAGDADT